MMEDQNTYFLKEIDDTGSSCSQSLIRIVTNNLEHFTAGPFVEDTDISKSPILNRAKRNEENTHDRVVWLEPAIKLLMSLVEEYRPKLGKTIKLKTKKKMWEAIEEAMRLYKYEYNASQIENKWKSLERRYKNKIQHNKKTGRDRASCSYEKELNNVFKGRDNIFPKYVLGASGNGKSQTELQEEAGIEDILEELETETEINTPEARNAAEVYPEIQSQENSPSVPVSQPQSRHKNENKSMIREISLLRQEKREYYAKKIDFQSQKLRAYEQRTKEIAEKNKLLKELITIQKQ